MRTLILISLFVFSLSACKDKDVTVPDGTPSCVSDKIKELKKDEFFKSDGTVKSYTFQDKETFVFFPGQFENSESTVTDNNCTTIGYLGGVKGNVIINGETWSNAKFKALIWKNEE